MAVIWGLDLHEIQWHKFKSAHMFNRAYHLRRTKMIIYQMAMIFCVCSESVGTAALSDYLDQQDAIQQRHPEARVHNNDFIGAASYNIFVGVSVATIFGAAFFFDLFWPERHESRSVRLAWKICGVIVSVMMLGSALTMTIITATHSARITGTDGASASKFFQESPKKPALKYRTNPKAVASVVLAWPGWIATVASTIILIKSQRHDDQFGPRSNYGREQEKEVPAIRAEDKSIAA
ncbi:uncharacterized protein ACLA_043290 [Aspergillus clavatus NRRL 1]|uniref:Uncharacterized protein n=1 Tax=Aspergillus clavatus (strain ATCC 1007 / CBS 513.65 / DSM 816 / NCTC 3887 / NRRL 1 / QM 1276 / 107) TaxID=344612 RepID=A1C8H3_ASPCL|nr:uncharacterized protein ACLA_043290 [Aspergillus clavatus NRRL 1]EAW13610.1 conserved hypothetical protein [Aspergillus clavatus NRRL 1]